MIAIRLENLRRQRLHQGTTGSSSGAAEDSGCDGATPSTSTNSSNTTNSSNNANSSSSINETGKKRKDLESPSSIKLPDKRKRTTLVPYAPPEFKKPTRRNSKSKIDRQQIIRASDKPGENETSVMMMYSNLLQIVKDNCYKCGLHDVSPEFVTRGQEFFVTVTCNKCNIVIRKPTHKLGEINRQTCLNIYAELLNGGGYQGFAKHNAFMLRENLDPRTFRKFTRFITERAVAECGKILQESRENVITEYTKNGILPGDNGILDVNVTCNVTWQSRGFHSKMGLFVVTEADTGLILDYHILTKYCNRCSSLYTLYNGKKITAAFFLLQRAKHEPFCKVNEQVNSGVMEAKTGQLIWGRSMTYKMRYVNIINEVDMAIYSGLINMNNGRGPYNDLQVNKIDWVNHYSKRLKSRLTKLIEDNHIIREINNEKTKLFLMKGKGRLSDAIVNKLSCYFGQIIEESTGTSIETMRNTIIASYLHCTSSDTKPNHNLCPTSKTSWCFYNKSIANNVEIPSHSTMKIFIHLKPVHHEQVLRIYKDLTEDDIIQRCSGRTKNNNETFHQRVWINYLKSQYRTKRTLDLAVAQAIADSNYAYCRSCNDKTLGFHRKIHTHLFLKKQNDVKDYQRSRVCDRCAMRYVNKSFCAVMCYSCLKEERITSSHLDNKCFSCGLIYCLDGESECPGCCFSPVKEFVCYKCELVTDNLALHKCRIGEEKEEQLPCDFEGGTAIIGPVEDAAATDSTSNINVWTGLQCYNSNTDCDDDIENLDIRKEDDNYSHLSHSPGVQCDIWKEEFYDEQEITENVDTSLYNLERQIVLTNSHEDNKGRSTKSGEVMIVEQLSCDEELSNPVEEELSSPVKAELSSPVKVEFDTFLQDTAPTITVWTGLQCSSSDDN
nr:uncharacterized protein LOC128698353 [Cherax quadricarinatus]